MTNVGIVGTGWVTDLHLKALKKIQGVSIRAIAGRNTQRGAELTADTGATVYEHWKPMLDREHLDAVFILLPPHLHGDLELACAGRVKGVLIEKPICADLKTAAAIHAAFERAGTIVSVAYQNRYRQSVQTVRQLLDAEMQKVVLVNGAWVGGIPGPLWWRTMSESGGQFVEQCTHVVDLARYIVGEITQVAAFSTRGFITDVQQFTVDDAMVVNAHFASGAVGNFTTACHALGFGDISLRLSTRTTQCTLSTWSWDAKVQKKDAAPEVHKSEEDVFLTQAEAFLRAVREDKPSLIRSSYADAMKTLAVTLAANESARTRTTVRVPDIA